MHDEEAFTAIRSLEDGVNHSLGAQTPQICLPELFGGAFQTSACEKLGCHGGIQAQLLIQSPCRESPVGCSSPSPTEVEADPQHGGLWECPLQQALHFKAPTRLASATQRGVFQYLALAFCRTPFGLCLRSLSFTLSIKSIDRISTKCNPAGLDTKVLTKEGRHLLCQLFGCVFVAREITAAGFKVETMS